MPIEAHCIANTSSKHFRPGPIRFHTVDKRVTIFVGLANVARCTYGDVQQPVRTESHKLPAVVAILWKLIIDSHRFRRIITQAGLDIVVPQYTVYLGN